ncbi:MAG TPA: FkbM family methyltransferase [Gemmatimonadales bacterium]|nr:FkbM family methyltransferase [Gemmatimonadales bacterium]
MREQSRATASVRIRQAFRTAKRWLKSRVGQDVFVRPNCSVPLVTLGKGAGSWTIWPDGLDQNSVLYSFGVGRDISFEREMIEQYGLTVHAFDPTPRALSWIATQRLPARLHFHELGLAAFDGIASFQAPIKSKFESFSMVRQSGQGSPIQAPVRRLQSILDMLGHTKVDVLKLDIEGAEYDVLSDVLAGGCAIGQILVEFHHRWREVSAAQTHRAISSLSRAGYSLAAVSSAGTEYTFVPTGAAAGRNSSSPFSE